MLTPRTPLESQMTLMGCGRSGGGAAAWTPADIADLAIFFHFKPGANCAYASNGGAAAGAGDPVGYAAPLFGAPISASNAIALLQPTLQVDGLQLDASGVQQLVFDSPFSSSAFTAYVSLAIVTGSNGAPFVNSSSGAASIGNESANARVGDDAFAQIDAGMLADTAALIRYAQISDGGANSLATSQGETAGGGLGSFTLDMLGGLNGGLSTYNDSIDNRFRLVILINRHIALGSAEDLLIRSWITANDGISL